MSEVGLVLVGVFLPLFPFSIVFNALLERLTNPLQRSALLLVWPLIGVGALTANTTAIPPWLVTWALLSSLLYAFRLVAMREMGRWTGFLATSAWALLWLAAYAGIPTARLWTFAAAFGAPLIFLTLLAQTLERQFGAAYIGLYGGLARRMPRFAGVLVISVLAATATPLFPAFFAMLHTLIVSQPVPAVVLTGIWLIWSWASARLLQGLIVGPAEPNPEQDLSISTTWSYAVALAVLIVAGLILIGSRL
jgi:NADH:ubiquinone oxidoreductase subunit 4 (subunit M)